jgi:hypothetical protein
VEDVRRLAGRPRAYLILLHCVMIRLAFCRRRTIFQTMLRPAPYLSRKLIRPIHAKDGGTLRIIARRSIT